MEEAFHAVATRVAASVEAWLPFPRRVRMDDRLDFPALQPLADGLRVVARVGYERLAPRVLFDDRFRDGRLVLLPGRELDVERAPFRVDECVDFC